ncbi:MAG TPA: polymer-forming cytoskeletal protein [Thermoanaerobaculia bacterium]|nr:polymer-forming cytoskeletal protein [Thermoanaerobaculia bacterium]
MNRKPGSLNGFLDKDARFEGKLSFEDLFRIDGTLKGSVVSDEELVVGESGTVEGDIRVGRLSVSGTVRGVVFARERIEVHAGGRVFAELHSPALVVEEGAVIQGPVETGPPQAAAATADRTSTSPKRAID